MISQVGICVGKAGAKERQRLSTKEGAPWAEGGGGVEQGSRV